MAQFATTIIRLGAENRDFQNTEVHKILQEDELMEEFHRISDLCPSFDAIPYFEIKNKQLGRWSAAFEGKNEDKMWFIYVSKI